MPIRVLWAIKGLGPGGAERLLVEAARAHDRLAFEIDCVFVRPDKDHLAESLEVAGVTTQCIGGDRRWPTRLFRLIRDGDYDVAHLHSPALGPAVRLAVLSCPSGMRPALVTTEHNARSTYHPISRLAASSTSRWDSAVICVSDEARRSIRGPSLQRSTAIVHGIDLEAARRTGDDRARVRHELGIGSDELIIATVANFREQKDYPTLLTAMQTLVVRGVPARLLVVGQGPLEGEIRRLIAQLGLMDRVILAGYRADAVRVLAASDVFTLASRWEGLPVALMEACALGLPVVCTRVGGLAESLVDEHDALLVDAVDPVGLADALQRTIEDSALRQRLSAASLLLASRFDAKRSTRQIEDIYLRVTRRSGNPETDRQRPVSTGSKAAHGVTIRRATEQDREEILDLGRRCLGWTDDPLHRWLFAWKHDQNPFGSSPGWVATHDDQVVGVRMLMRWEFVRDGQVLRAFRAVDTATSPEFSGRGIFSALTSTAISETASDVDFVFNTPNDQSRPGYLKLGWQSVGYLPAAVRLAGPTAALAALRARTPASIESQELTVGQSFGDWFDGSPPTEPMSHPSRTLETHATPAFLRWRYGEPALRYRVIDTNGAALIVRARRRGAANELVLAAHPGLPRKSADRLVADVLEDSGCDYVIRLGPPDLRTGFVPVGRGPLLTWRSMALHAMPPRPNWNLGLGDIELF